MLEIKDEKVKLWYQFNSRCVKKDGYERYDYDEFDYELDLYDVKFDIVYNYLKITKNLDNCKLRAVIEVLDEMEKCEEINWEDIIKNNEDMIMDDYREEAMEYFVEQHQDDEGSEE